MAQVSWRADDELVQRARERAYALKQSLNQYLTLVVSAATDPDLAGDEAAQLRERLARAGLLADPPAAVPRPDPAAVAAAGRRAGKGRSVAGLLVEDRDQR